MEMMDGDILSDVKSPVPLQQLPILSPAADIQSDSRQVGDDLDHLPKIIYRRPNAANVEKPERD
jgi:hypothetical protein